MSRLQVIRKTTDPDHYTIGDLLFDGDKQCVTLEPGVNRLPHPMIPAGVYMLILVKEGHVYEDMCRMLTSRAQTQSQRDIAKSFVDNGIPSPQNVPGRSFIRIHIGNSEKDTEGCLLLGTSISEAKSSIVGSTAAYYSLYPTILDYIQNYPDHTIEYIDIN
jgi:hypothetical protein